MFKLKSLYAVFIPASLCLFHLLYASGRIPYAYACIIPVLIAPACYVYSQSFSYMLIALSWIILYPLFVFGYHVDGLSASMPLILLSFLGAVYIWYKKTDREDRMLHELRLKVKKEEKSNFLQEFEKADRFESGIRAKEMGIVNLYEITKKMSEYLKFEDMFGAFSIFLKENFAFRRCALLILKKEEKGSLCFDREYGLWQEEPAGKEDRDKIDSNKLMGLFSGGFKNIYISRNDDAEVFKRIDLEDSRIETLAVIPLLSEKMIVGMLAIENLPKADAERFVILSMQFALEIKKVLLYEMVEKMAITDSLTGLYVRRYFYERMSEELQRSRRYKFRFSFLMIDIDNFKSCNDTYGHLVGDVVLKDITHIMKEDVREIDIVSRYGGEEIAIVLPETGAENARIVAERLRKKIEENVFRAYDERLRLTVSIGISVYPDDSDGVDSLIEKADEALYIAKKSGKNLVCEYKKGYNESA